MHAMVEAGVLKHSNGLQPTTTATTARIRDGKTQVFERTLLTRNIADFIKPA